MNIKHKITFIFLAYILLFFITSTETNAMESIPALPPNEFFPPIHSTKESVPEIIPSSRDNIYKDLKVVTQVTKIDNLYFIVDCYHDQIIYHDNLESPLDEWKVLTNQVSQPHTIASDGVVYLIDDTENHRLLAFEKSGNRFVHTQTFSDIGNRPHYIVYDVSTVTFYAWSSLTGEMYLIKRDPMTNQLYIFDIKKIPELYGQYVRSFFITENSIYFPSGDNCTIVQAEKNTFEIIKRFPVPESYAGMVQLTKIEDYFYITISTDKNLNQNSATLLRVKDLDDFANAEEIFSKFGTTGTPYYISKINNYYYITHHRTNPGFWSFSIQDNQINNIRKHY